MLTFRRSGARRLGDRDRVSNAAKIVLLVIVILDLVIVKVLLDGEIVIVMDNNSIGKDSNSSLKEHYVILLGRIIKTQVI